MATLNVFESLSLDGYFSGKGGDLGWAHARDPEDQEWNEFVAGNASGGGALLFGRVTYEMMASYWPTPQAAKDQPAVAKGMNERQKYVVSRTLGRPVWKNTTLIESALVEAVRRLEAGKGPDITVLGSGKVVSALTEAGLVDTYQLVTIPVVLGAGRTLFEGVARKVELKTLESRKFRNGNVVTRYARA
jgi:dihydrofolate reductase